MVADDVEEQADARRASLANSDVMDALEELGMEVYEEDSDEDEDYFENEDEDIAPIATVSNHSTVTSDNSTNRDMHSAQEARTSPLGTSETEVERENRQLQAALYGGSVSGAEQHEHRHTSRRGSRRESHRHDSDASR